MALIHAKVSDNDKFVWHIRAYCCLTNQVIVVPPDIHNLPPCGQVFLQRQSLFNAMEGGGGVWPVQWSFYVSFSEGIFNEVFLNS